MVFDDRFDDRQAQTGPGVSYAYNPADQLLSASRGGATATFGYDMAGRKKSMSDPDLGNWGYTYDGTGSLASQTDARSCATSLGYDSLNRLVSKSYSNCPTTSSVTYTYDDDVYAEAFGGSSLTAGWTKASPSRGGVVTLVGNGSWNNYLIRDNNQALMDGQAVEFSFTVTSGAVHAGR